MHKVVPKGEVDAPKQDADGEDEGRKGEEHTATQLQQLSGPWYQALNQQQRQQDIQRNLASVAHICGFATGGVVEGLCKMSRER